MEIRFVYWCGNIGHPGEWRDAPDGMTAATSSANDVLTAVGPEIVQVFQPGQVVSCLASDMEPPRLSVLNGPRIDFVEIEMRYSPGEAELMTPPDAQRSTE